MAKSFTKKTLSTSTFLRVIDIRSKAFWDANAAKTETEYSLHRRICRAADQLLATHLNGKMNKFWLYPPRTF